MVRAMTEAPSLPAMSVPALESELLALLDRLGIPYVRHAHEAVFTVAESSAKVDAIPGAHTKNLFLKEKKGGFWLISCRGDRRVKVRDIAREAGGKNPSFGNEEDLMRLIGVRPGSVTPFGLVNDRGREVRLILDAEMMQAEFVNFHPLRNDATLQLRPADLLRFFEATGHAPTLVAFDPHDAGPEEA